MPPHKISARMCLIHFRENMLAELRAERQQIDEAIRVFECIAVGQGRPTGTAANSFDAPDSLEKEYQK